MNLNASFGFGLALLLGGAQCAVAAGDENPFAEYRAMFGDDNPAELVEMQGDELWRAARGPKQTTLAACDFGLGAGVIKGAYAQLPRYFADTGKSMDLESRLLHCMETLQGLEVTALRQNPYSEQGRPQTDLESLSAYIAAQSRGMPVAVPQSLKIGSFRLAPRSPTSSNAFLMPPEASMLPSV